MMKSPWLSTVAAVLNVVLLKTTNAAIVEFDTTKMENSI